MPQSTCARKASPRGGAAAQSRRSNAGLAARGLAGGRAADLEVDHLEEARLGDEVRQHVGREVLAACAGRHASSPTRMRMCAPCTCVQLARQGGCVLWALTRAHALHVELDLDLRRNRQQLSEAPRLTSQKGTVVRATRLGADELGNGRRSLRRNTQKARISTLAGRLAMATVDPGWLRAPWGRRASSPRPP